MAPLATVDASTVPQATLPLLGGQPGPPELHGFLGWVVECGAIGRSLVSSM